MMSIRKLLYLGFLIVLFLVYLLFSSEILGFLYLSSVKCFYFCDTRSRWVFALCKGAKIRRKKEYLSSVFCMATIDFQLQYRLNKMHYLEAPNLWYLEIFYSQVFFNIKTKTTFPMLIFFLLYHLINFVPRLVRINFYNFFKL